VKVMEGGGDGAATLLFSLAVEGAAHGARAAVEDVGVDLCGLDVLVAESFLQCACAKYFGLRAMK